MSAATTGVDDHPGGAVASGITPDRLTNLRRWNIGLTLLHAAQAAAVLLLASDFAITITSSYPEGPPGTRAPRPEALFDVRIGVAIAVFLGLAALDHLLTGTVMRSRYESDLRSGINRFRWVEYSFSATLMVLLIGSYSGITNINAIVAIIGANVAMILFGWLQELMNPPGRSSTTMLPFWFGTLVGLAPWIAIRDQLRRSRGDSGIRLRHLRGAGPVLLQLRDQPVAAVPGRRSMVQLCLR